MTPSSGDDVDRGEDVEALLDRLDDADAEPLAPPEAGRAFIPPDEDGARLRIDDDIEAVFGRVVDDDVERQRGGDAAARSLDDEDARPARIPSHSSQRCD